MYICIFICMHVCILEIQKTYQFINVVNGVSRSHKTANIFFFILLSSIACYLECIYETQGNCNVK